MANTNTPVFIQFVFSVENQLSFIESTAKDKFYKYFTGIVQTDK